MGNYTLEDIRKIKVVNFKDSEWACNDKYRDLTNPPYCNGGIGKGIDMDLKHGLQLVRNTLWAHGIEKPVNIISGYRCRAYNDHQSVRGAKNSQHLYGTAADISVQGMTTEALMEFVEYLDIFTGRGLYPGRNFIHVDTRRGIIGTPTRWVQTISKGYISVPTFAGWIKPKPISYLKPND
jgi:hypothetical protein